MRWGVFTVLALTLIAPLGAAPRQPAPKPAPFPKVIQTCDAHKFETVVDAVVDGQPRKSKVKLCGVEGQSDADWIGTLRDAIRKLEANKDMAAATRDQIVAAIKTEIARLSIIGPTAPTRREAEGQSSPPLSRDYAALPPLPAAPPEPIVAPAAPIATDAVGMPASPTPKPAAASIPVSAPPAIVVPRLTISCETPSDLGGPAPCAGIERETQLTIRADGNVPAGTVLQFIRNGRAQGDLSLDGLRRNGALRTGLPRSVCAGFGAGRLEFRIVQTGGSQVVRSEGPYSLRC